MEPRAQGGIGQKSRKAAESREAALPHRERRRKEERLGIHRRGLLCYEEDSIVEERGRKMAEEATVNPDGSTTFGSEGAAGEDVPPNMGGDDFEEAAEEIAKGIDPAFYLLFAVVIVGGLLLYNLLNKRKKNANMDDFFSNLDGDKFNIKLPAAVDEYYEVKTKCESDGWEPGQPMTNGQPTNHHRLLAQALMKRCIADIPIVTHIQKESQGMNKLYSQSMCSVKQWKSYQAAEAMVSAEVEEVRAEADEIEPGWSQVSTLFSFVLTRFQPSVMGSRVINPHSLQLQNDSKPGRLEAGHAVS